MKVLILITTLLPFLAFSQTTFSPITDEAKLKIESMKRTVFIRGFLSADRKDPPRSTGIILKDGYIITNEHVLRPHLNGRKVAFHIFTYGKKSFHKFEEVYLLGCDIENDICLLKTDRDYGDSFFSLEPPSFRTISKDKPVGLYKDEMIFFNGFCNEFSKMTKGKYVTYTDTAYEWNEHKTRTNSTTAVQFSLENGGSVACGGDSGGPLFDYNLYLYGMVRDSVFFEPDKTIKNFAVPINIIRDFVKKTKSSSQKNKIQTINSFEELDTIFKATTP